MSPYKLLLSLFLLTLFSCEKETLYHQVTIKNGTGSGIYEIGDEVQIAANPPAEKMEFGHWAGHTEVLADPDLASTSFTMPLKDIELEAIYADLPYFFLTVKNGTGSGEYLAESTITIEAQPATAGFGFYRWSGDTSTVANPKSPKTTLLMPFANTTLEASYKELPKYQLTIHEGNGSGEYLEGTEINIEANTPEIGLTFFEWIGDIDYLNNASAAYTFVTMPAKNIELSAAYQEDSKYTLSVFDGEGSGQYYPREQVAIVAHLHADNHPFQQWEGDISHIDDPNSIRATVTMPTNDISITAIYQEFVIPSFKDVIFPIIDDNCADIAGCHGENDILPDLTTYEKIKLSAHDIKEVILIGKMPLTGGLSKAEIQAIVDWVDAGAPNN